MSLHAALTRVKTEEDVKDAYIEALGLKGVNKGLVDIQTPEIWFEAKEAPTPPLLMFAQLLVYVRAARKRGDENAAKFGRSTPQKLAEKDAKARAARHLDQHQREASDDGDD